jgi:hypothetical protein
MDEKLSIPVTRDQADWLRREAEREERPVAFIARRCIEQVRREQERTAA